MTGGSRAAFMAALGTSFVLLTHAQPASAQRARHRFEPTDLQIQEQGVAEIDMQAGITASDDGSRLYTPDFEASLGIDSHAEIEVDGALGFDQQSTPRLIDNTLVAVRIAMFDVRDTPTSKSGWTGGVQAGPRLPTLASARGLGFEGIALLGRSTEHLHVYAQAGTLIDPKNTDPSVSTGRPVGVEGGVDVDIDLDARELWSLKAEVGGVKFLSAHQSQLHLTGGPAVWATPWLELSLIGIVGFLPGGDRVGLLLGAASRFRVF